MELCSPTERYRTGAPIVSQCEKKTPFLGHVSGAPSKRVSVMPGILRPHTGCLVTGLAAHVLWENGGVFMGLYAGFDGILWDLMGFSHWEHITMEMAIEIVDVPITNGVCSIVL